MRIIYYPLIKSIIIAKQAFTDALDQYLPKDKWKYFRYTNAIYKAVFAENATEYK